MLMTVLKGELAIKQSKALIRLFKKMKDFIIENQYLVGPKDFIYLSRRVDLLAEDNKKFIEEMKNFATKDSVNQIHQQTKISIEKQNAKIETLASKDNLIKIEKDLNILMNNFIDESKLKHFLILNGEKIEADIAYTNIYKLAKHSLYIVDNYISLKTLELLRVINKDIKVIIFSDNLHHNNKLTKNIFIDFKNEYPNININLKKTNGMFHDRYIFIDSYHSSEMVYHCGSSSKDSGNKITTISQVEDTSIYHLIIDNLLNNPNLKL